MQAPGGTSKSAKFQKANPLGPMANPFSDLVSTYLAAVIVDMVGWLLICCLSLDHWIFSPLFLFLDQSTHNRTMNNKSTRKLSANLSINVSQAPWMS
jgi:hypothetical protein